MVVGGKTVISFDNNGNSEVAKTPEEVVREKIKLLLHTNKGDYPNNPNYGADLVHFVHLPPSDLVLASIENTIRAEVSSELPYVTILSVERSEVALPGVLNLIVVYSVVAGVLDSIDVSV